MCASCPKPVPNGTLTPKEMKVDRDAYLERDSHCNAKIKANELLWGCYRLLVHLDPFQALGQIMGQMKTISDCTFMKG